MIRMPAVAGSFYPVNPEMLRIQVEQCFRDPIYGPGSIPAANPQGMRRVTGLICPHAGYPYSGYAAARAYHALALDGIPETIVLIGPNHHGRGYPAAVSPAGMWHTPLGEIPINDSLASELIQASQYLQIDEEAHYYEHSLEVQLPFLQYIYGDQLKIVPILLGGFDPRLWEDLGAALSDCLAGRDAVVIASSDMSHYLDHDTAVTMDHAAIDSILSMSHGRFIETVLQREITVCGVAPIASLLAAARASESLHARLLGYNTSGDITGDTSRVVGYASIAFEREA